MTDRERWTVYPLIFLTLGIALKDKVAEVVDVRCRNLICNAVHVTDFKGREQALVAATEHGGQLRTFGQGVIPTVIVGQAKQVAGLMFVDAQGTVLPGSIVATAPQPPATPQPQGEPEPEPQDNSGEQPAQPSPR